MIVLDVIKFWLPPCLRFRDLVSMLFHSRKTCGNDWSVSVVTASFFGHSTYFRVKATIIVANASCAGIGDKDDNTSEEEL